MNSIEQTAPTKVPKSVEMGVAGVLRVEIQYLFVPDGLISLGQVSYAEVEHWMWRLFLDDFGQVCEDLGLSPLPVSAFLQTDLPRPTPLLYGVSSVVLPRQPYWPER